MRAKTTTDFKRGQEPKRSLGIGVSPKDWAERIAEKLIEVGIETNTQLDEKEGILEYFVNFTNSMNPEKPLENNEIWLSIDEEEWNLISGSIQKAIYTQREDRDIDEMVSEIVKFEYDDPTLIAKMKEIIKINES